MSSPESSPEQAPVTPPPAVEAIPTEEVIEAVDPSEPAETPVVPVLSMDTVRFNYDDLFDDYGMLTPEGQQHAATLLRIGYDLRPYDQELGKAQIREAFENPPDQQVAQQDEALRQQQEIARARALADEEARTTEEHESDFESRHEERARAAQEHPLFEGNTTAENSIPEKDRWAIERYGIPTYASTQNTEETEEQRKNATLTRFERGVRKVGNHLQVLLQDIESDNLSTSHQNDEAVKFVNEIQSTGPDDEVRALFARYDEETGRWMNIYTNKEVSGDDVTAARALWLDSPSRLQAAIWYEFTKVKSEKEFGIILDRAFELCNEAAAGPKADIIRMFTRTPKPFEEKDIIGIWKGLGFMHKGMHLSFKHLSFTTNKNPSSETFGEFDWVGFNAVEYITELSTKFKSYEMSGFSAVDAANVAQMADIALDVMLKNKHKPDSADFKKAQYIMSRLTWVTNELRAGTPNVGLDPSEEDSRAQAMMDQRAQEIIMQNREGQSAARTALRQPDMYRKESVKFDEKEGKYVYVGAYTDPRTGGAAAVAGQWKKIAGFVDKANDIFGQLKYGDDEFSTVQYKIDAGGAFGNPKNTQGEVLIGIHGPEDSKESFDAHAASSRQIRQAEEARYKSRRRNRRYIRNSSGARKPPAPK